jgi:tRNA-specific 2-thiouridylase
MSMVKRSVAVGLSGGIDSLYAAKVLRDEGWEVVGVHLLLPIPPRDRAERIKAVRLLSDELHIPLFFLDVKDPFKEKVIDYFISSYCQGTTPNPCVVCNHAIKFDRIIAWMDTKGIDWLATGHYARVRKSSRGEYSELLKGKDGQKDQSYFLHRLNQVQLSRTVFPLGDITKDEVKLEAGARELPRGFHSESQEICFVSDNDYRTLLQGKMSGKIPSSGNIVDLQGNVLGTHAGTYAYTVGQRHGLGIASRNPLYVRSIRPETSEIVVAPKDGLFSKCLVAQDFHWIGPGPDAEMMRGQAKIRYRHRPANGTLIVLSPGVVRCEFDEPQWAVTPGQALVWYKGDRVLGGGWITRQA